MSSYYGAMLLIIIIIVGFGMFAFLIMFSVYFCLLSQIQGIWIPWKYFLNSVTEHFPNSQRFIFTFTHSDPFKASSDFSPAATVWVGIGVASSPEEFNEIHLIFILLHFTVS